MDNRNTNYLASVDYVMGKNVPGSFDGLKLVPPGGSDWRLFPSNNPLLKKPLVVTFNGGIPLKYETVPMKMPKDSMFMFDKNISSPYCCPSTYTSDQGCICTTPQQRDLIGLYRGNNKHYNTNPDV